MSLWTADLHDNGQYFVRSADGVEPRLIIADGLVHTTAVTIATQHNAELRRAREECAKIAEGWDTGRGAADAIRRLSTKGDGKERWTWDVNDITL